MSKTDRNGSGPGQRGKKPVSRRAFLKGTGLIVAATSASSVVAGCAPGAGPRPAPTPVLTLDDKYLHVPPAPRVPPDPERLQFFTPQEARTVEAVVARVLPGTAEDPGAREAGVLTFIDHLLATNEGYAEPTYTGKPVARFYEGDEPPPEAADTDPAEVIWVPQEWQSNYGWQAVAPPQELYRTGLAVLDDLAGGSFADLSEAEQDFIVRAMANAGDGNGGGSANGGGEADAVVQAFEDLIPNFSASSFFDLLQKHVTAGMFADPLYGGNRFMAGWQLVGYPGAQRAYTERDMHNEDLTLEPQSLAHLPPLNPGEPVNDHVVIPLADGRQYEGEIDPNAREAQLMQFCRIRR